MILSSFSHAILQQLVAAHQYIDRVAEHLATQDASLQPIFNALHNKDFENILVSVSLPKQVGGLWEKFAHLDEQKEQAVRRNKFDSAAKLLNDGRKIIEDF